ncbi:glycoside hydrolase family 27 protein [Actinoplanes sp. NPDC089786]|uniref:glycoside hydrolase family 27 protein n=1 Tax=Actinoplanes sp. NPDC089786 TaxID=3155185 RepID=UPI003433990D
MNLAPTPPMGWNSWDSYGTSVTEAEVLANADFMARHLLPHGWNTIVVDIQWHDPTARAGGYNPAAPLHLDDCGRPYPAVNRFPSAANGEGFRPLADRIHALDLKFGLHIMRGVPRLAADAPTTTTTTTTTTGGRRSGGGLAGLGDIADRDAVCPWNTDNYGLDHDRAGAQEYYDSLGTLFAGWGVDFVKADDMLWPYHEREIESFATALRRSGRDIALSLSPGKAMSLERLDHLRANASMWRISDDLWDRWEDVEAQFARLATWAPHARPGGWPDADMLPLGHIGIRAERGTDRMSLLTPDEQRTLMSLWCLARSPLMMGGDLPTSPADTISLLTNDSVLTLLSNSHHNRQVIRDGALIAWTAEATDRDARYAGLFNLASHPTTVRVRTADLGFRQAESITDLWTNESLPLTPPDLTTDIPAHGCRLLRINQPAT